MIDWLRIVAEYRHDRQATPVGARRGYLTPIRCMISIASSSIDIEVLSRKGIA
jgi:hypothetical protein